MTHSQILKSHKKHGNLNDIAYNNTNIKGKRWGKKKYEKEMKKLEDEKLSHYLCFKCHMVGHLAMDCPNKKRKRPQDSSEEESNISQKQVNVNREVDNKIGKKKVRRGGRRRNLSKNFFSDGYYHSQGHFAQSCPKGITPKPSLIHDDHLLRKVGNGAVKATISNHSIVRAMAIWVPKHEVTNMRGPNTVWVPSSN
jgi:hypothetical protein